MPINPKDLADSTLSSVIVRDGVEATYSQTRGLMDVDGNGNFVSMIGSSLISPPVGNPNLYGYTGGNWVLNDTTDRYIPKTGTHALLDAVSVSFNNATGGATWDQQFVAGERFTFVISPTKVKDNLQTMEAKARMYYTDAEAEEAVPVTVPAEAGALSFPA